MEIRHVSTVQFGKKYASILTCADGSNRADPELLDFMLWRIPESKHLAEVQSVHISTKSTNMTFASTKEQYYVHNGIYIVGACSHGTDAFLTLSDGFEIMAATPAATSSSSLSPSEKAAIALGVILIILCSSLVVVYVILHQRKRQQRIVAIPDETSGKEIAHRYETQELDGTNTTALFIPSKQSISTLAPESPAIPYPEPAELAPPTVHKKHKLQPWRPNASISGSYLQPAGTGSGSDLPELADLLARQRHLGQAIEATESLSRLRSEQENLAQEIQMAEERARRSMLAP